MAVSLNPRCPNSFQTLGRAQVAFGEIEMVCNICRYIPFAHDVKVDICRANY